MKRTKPTEEQTNASIKIGSIASIDLENQIHLDMKPRHLLRSVEARRCNCLSEGRREQSECQIESQSNPEKAKRSGGQAGEQNEVPEKNWDQTRPRHRQKTMRSKKKSRRRRC
ncbi:unnamed protein product [Brassica rapa]|uniref:Uncharacterized protein n=1 Tax=Brassica campestris TaxID=3711 RepID=A0A8D9D7Y8_BRACM|nr:unnamed protein product [Brassica rapa]